MTIATVGQAGLIAATLSCCLGILFSGLALLRGPALSGRYAGIAQQFLYVAFASVFCGAAIVVYSLVQIDLRLRIVEQHVNRDLPWGYRIASLWSSQEGSLLLWLLLLLGMSAILSVQLRKSEHGIDDHFKAGTISVLLFVALFFSVLTTFIARPFAWAPLLQNDGSGLSPTLQNVWMAAHPPALYVGYVGVVIPLALFVGAIASSKARHDDQWLSLARKWSMVAWLGLTIGLALGARWAYYEIGWGGHWAWDPVENAAFMPWLTLTALIHSMLVQARRGMFRWWNLLLALLTFSLSIFGTFLTRSGILSSVHSFVDSPVGWWFTGFLAFAVIAGVGLLARTSVMLSSKRDVRSFFSREALLMINNVLLVAFSLTVLWGVSYPIFSEAFFQNRISIQAPWYNFFTQIFGIPILFMMAMGVVIKWAGSPWKKTLNQVAAPAGLSTIVAVALIMVFGVDSAVAAIVIGLSIFNGLLIGIEFMSRARARNAASAQKIPAAALAMISANRRRWGAHIAHLGIALIAVAFALTNAWDSSVERTLRNGQVIESKDGSWSARWVGVDRRVHHGVMQVRARFEVNRGSHRAGVVTAGRDFHPASGETSTEVGTAHHLLTATDAYITVDRMSSDGKEAKVRLIINPGIGLLWIGAIVVVLGGLIAAVPRRVRSVGRAAPMESGQIVASAD